MMGTLLCTPGLGLTLGVSGRARRDDSAASAVYVRLDNLWGGRWWDGNKRPATKAERVTTVSPLGEPMVAARARYIEDDLVKRGVIKDVTITATANFELNGYDLTVDYFDLLTGQPGQVKRFMPLI